jgi:hypothetical protein
MNHRSPIGMRRAEYGYTVGLSAPESGRAAGERNDERMLHRSPHTTTNISRRSHAQRRLRRAAAHRLFCSTNGCTTFLVPDEEGKTASCPVCGLQRTLRPARDSRQAAPRH